MRRTEILAGRANMLGAEDACVHGYPRLPVQCSQRCRNSGRCCGEWLAGGPAAVYDRIPTTVVPNLHGQSRNLHSPPFDMSGCLSNSLIILKIYTLRRGKPDNDLF